MNYDELNKYIIFDWGNQYLVRRFSSFKHALEHKKTLYENISSLENLQRN